MNKPVRWGGLEQHYCLECERDVSSGLLFTTDGEEIRCSELDDLDYCEVIIYYLCEGFDDPGVMWPTEKAYAPCHEDYRYVKKVVIEDGGKKIRELSKSAASAIFDQFFDKIKKEPLEGGEDHGDY
jgi:hypothetical protein